MDKIQMLKQKRAALIAEMRKLQDATEGKRSFTTEEEGRYGDLRSQVAEIGKQIKSEEELRSLEAGTAAPAGESGTNGGTGGEEFRNIGEFLQEIRFNPQSARLQKRAMSASAGATGGFQIPSQFDTAIQEIARPGALFRNLGARIIPPGSAPDAEFTIFALDQSGSKGVYGGVVTKWTGEGTVQGAGDPNFIPITVKPQGIAAYLDIEQKLLNNADALSAYAMGLIADAKVGAEDDAFYTGDGIGKPLGIVGCSASIAVTRTTANRILYADVKAMYVRAKKGRNTAWVVNDLAAIDLLNLKDDDNRPVWLPNASVGVPPTLMGLPVRFYDGAPSLGNEGDLALVDYGYYTIKDGSPMSILVDPYTQALNNKVRFIAKWNVDGQPSIASPLLLRDGVSQVSPFVVLK